MAFSLFMIAFAFLLTLILWVIFKPRKRQPAKKTKRQVKKIPAKKKPQPPINDPLNPKPVVPSQEFKRKVATELLKRNPDIVTQVVKQWLREK